MSTLLRGAVFAFLAILLMPTPALAQMQRARNDATMQQAHAIGAALFAYATDNNGAYPTGKSSTEIFQKLIDGNYVSDPSTFYFKMPGKVAPTSNKLKPENVCFDVTVLVDGTNSSDQLPVVFSTGYRISYTPGSSAVPLSDATKQAGGISIYYKGNNAVFLRAGPDGSVPNVVSPNFNDPNAAHYQQLTPDGSLQANV